MAFDPYESAKLYFEPRNAPAYAVTDDDKSRIQSYDLYEKIYWTQPHTFKVVQRGSDSYPIYLPTARKIIEACNRFLAVDFNYLLEGADSQFVPLIESFFKRERFFTKFATQKRYGLIRGDALWHIVGDDTKPEGERLSIYELDPRTYFPIMDPDNAEKRIGCHLVDIITDPKDENRSKKIAQVQTYRKDPETGRITSELNHYEVAGWDDRNLPPKDIKFIRNVMPRKDLPEQIRQLPVYRMPNTRIPGPRPFSFSELLGIERVFAAVTQAVSDEELALAMAGLGVFWTTAGPPKDEQGRIVPWDIGPARMLEIAKDTEIGRLAGITSVQPNIDHMNFIIDETQGGLGIPDIAAGKVDVTIAESGISLNLQLSPLLAKNAEKEGSMIESYDQMFYDIMHGWLPAYEGSDEETTATLLAVAGDPMPRNRKAEIDELFAAVAAKVISITEARQILIKKFGYTIQESAEALLAETAQLAAAEDPFASRTAGELDGETGAAGQQPPTNNGAVIPARVS